MDLVVADALVSDNYHRSNGSWQFNLVTADAQVYDRSTLWMQLHWCLTGQPCSCRYIGVLQVNLMVADAASTLWLQGNWGLKCQPYVCRCTGVWHVNTVDADALASARSTLWIKMHWRDRSTLRLQCTSIKGSLCGYRCSGVWPVKHVGADVLVSDR